jgi:hypothetical protein
MKFRTLNLLMAFLFVSEQKRGFINIIKGLFFVVEI